MSKKKSTPAIDPRALHIKSMCRWHWPEVKSISSKSLAPQTEDEILNTGVNRNRTDIMVIEVSGKESDIVIGYMIYDRLPNHALRALRLEVDPAYRDTVFANRSGMENKTVEETCVQWLKNKLSSQNKTLIEFVVNERNESLLNLLDKEGDFVVRGAEPFLRNHYKTGDGAVVLRYQQPGARKADVIAAEKELEEYTKNPAESTPELSAEEAEQAFDEDTPIKPTESYKRLPSDQLLRQMRRKLTELTRMEWEIVSPNKRGKLVEADVENGITDTSNLYFQTYKPVANPRGAYIAARDFFGAKAPLPHAGALDKPSKLVLPAAWARQIHLELGAPGSLAEAFKPADLKARYRGFEDENWEQRGRD